MIGGKAGYSKTPLALLKGRLEGNCTEPRPMFPTGRLTPSSLGGGLGDYTPSRLGWDEEPTLMVHAMGREGEVDGGA